MRDPNRIEPFLAALAEHWKKVPDQRFGQMVMNLCRDNIGRIQDPWEWEEPEWLEKMNQHQQQDGERGRLRVPDKQQSGESAAPGNTTSTPQVH